MKSAWKLFHSGIPSWNDPYGDFHDAGGLYRKAVLAQVADVSRFKAESRGNHPCRTETANTFCQGPVAGKCKLRDRFALERCNLHPQGWAGVGSMWPGPGRGGGTGPGELVGGEVADANRGAVSGAQGGDGGGGGDGTVVAGEGYGAASRMADAGTSGGDGGVENVYGLAPRDPGEPDGEPAG